LWFVRREAKREKDGEPVRDQTMIDRLWVTTQKEAMIESGDTGDGDKLAIVQWARKESEGGTDEKTGDATSKQAV